MAKALPASSPVDIARAQAHLELRRRRLLSYRDDPVGFVHDCFEWAEGEEPAAYQDEIMTAIFERGRVAARGPHGLGKTALAAWIVLWFALTRDGDDWKIATTASAWRQLTKFLWPEVRKWARRVRWDYIGREPFNGRTELQTLSLKLATGEAFAVASDNQEFIEGAHADHMMYIFDESKAIPDAIFDAAEGAFSGQGEVFALAISTPGAPMGRFYDIHKRKPGYDDWWVRHVTVAESIAAGRIAPEWVEQREKQWGAESSIYRNRVLGEFAADDEEGVIPLSWVEAANDRWHAWNDSGRAGVITAVGVDVARSGNDKTVFAFRHGNVIGDLQRTAKEDTMKTAGRVTGMLRQNQDAYAVIDVIGIGAGVVDRVGETMPGRAHPFNASVKADGMDMTHTWNFRNLRSYAWWHVRDLLNPANDAGIALPPDDTLTGDLTAPRYTIMSGAVVAVESKEQIKKRLGRSPDDGDAVVMALCDTVEPSPLLLW